MIFPKNGGSGDLGSIYGSRQIEFSRRQRLEVGGGVKESN